MMKRVNDSEFFTRPIRMGSESAGLRIVIFHGYTTSPDEFVPLAEQLVRRFDAHVYAPLLPGHGTQERNLLGLSFDNFANAAKQAISSEAGNARQLVVIGHSLGGLLALSSISERVPNALVLSSVPYILGPRFAKPWKSYYMRLRSFWPKKISDEELKQRSEFFFYRNMPGNALMLVHEGVRRAQKSLRSVSCPILAVGIEGDPICAPESCQALLDASGKHPLNRLVVYEGDTHGLYYGPHKDQVIEGICDFVRQALSKA